MNQTQDSTTDNAENQAIAQLENIRSMVLRLEDATACDGSPEECGLTNDEILEGLDYPKGQKLTAEDREQYHDEDEARQRIDEDPLSVMVRSGWTEPGQKFAADEYEILLCTGGPAVRIIGALSEYSEPDSARLQYQDWGTPWTELLKPRDTDALIAYANHFYFGE